MKGAHIPLFGIILAGGSGTRFWPLSRHLYPKQVLRLLGSQSMLEATISRLLPRIPLNRLGVVTSASQAEVIRLELFRQGREGMRLWLEPEAKNTAAAVGLAAVLLSGEPEAETLAIFPADHYIANEGALHAALDVGVLLAQEGYLVTFGIAPSRPETGYGYIKAGRPLLDGQAYEAERFVEKPPLGEASRYLEEGGYYWNSGIFVFRREVFLEALARYLPETYAGLLRLTQGEGSPSLQEVYAGLPAMSLDHGVMEKAPNVAVVPAELGWSDVGSWSALYDLLPADSRGNVRVGRVHDRDSEGSLVVAQERLVATLGLRDMLVVDTPDATLVCHRNRVQEVKDLVADLKRQNLVESQQHLTVERPWGRYTVLTGGPGFQVKQVEVLPGKRLSLQFHRFRAEHWVVVQGVALVTIGTEMRRLQANESVYVPVEAPHRLENPGPDLLRLIEVQAGSYLGEDDIVRLADDFWRQSEEAGS